MRQIAGNAERGPIVSATVVLCALTMLAMSVYADARVSAVAPLLALVVLVAAAAKRALAWPNLLAILILTILFIPIRRYSLPGQLPFHIEPYRLFVALVVMGWASSLLIDRRVRLRRSGLEGPLFLFLFAVLGSVGLNGGLPGGVETYAFKQITFLVSFLFVFYLIVSVVRSIETIDYLVRVLVVGGAILGLTTIWEARTQYNVYNHLSTILPFLRVEVIPWVGQDGRGDRAYGSAQHAISLGAALILLLPLAIYLARKTGSRRWWLAALALMFGALATHSRTSVLMLVVIVIVYAVLRPVETRRAWPALLPVLLVLHFAVPGTIGTLKNSFFPAGGLLAQQRDGAGTAGSGRLADVGPALHDWADRPLLGAGYGTRIVEGPLANANILDDQWLATLLETGIVGVMALIWLFVRVVRRLCRSAKDDDSPRAWLLVGLAAAISAYGFSMLTFDAFSFIQVTFLFFFVLGFASVLTTPENEARLAGRPFAVARGTAPEGAG